MKRLFDKLSRAIDRIISGSILKQFLFFLFIAVFIFFLAFIIRLSFLTEQGTDFFGLLWNTLFNFISMEGFDDYQGFELALIFLLNMLGIVIFSGTLVAIITNVIFSRIENANNGDIYYSFHDHIVIIGYDKICDDLIVQLAENNEVVLQTSGDVNVIRHELFSNLPEKLTKRVYVVSGNRILHEDIEKLNIDKCRQLFLFGEMNDNSRDSKNIDCLKIIINILKTNGKQELKCHVFFEHHATFAAFEQQEIPGIRGTIDLIPFNFYDMWAQIIFVKNNYNDGEIIYKPLDYIKMTEDCDKRVHLIILGMSDMGISLGLQTAQICHFPNFITKGIKTRITFIDNEAIIKMESLKMRLNSFFDEIDYLYSCYEENIYYDSKSVSSVKKFTDIEFEFIKANFENQKVQEYIKTSALDANNCLTIACALSDQSASLTAALYLPAAIFDTETNVLVRQEQSHSIVSMLAEEKEGDVYRKYRNLRPFGMINKCYEVSGADEILPMMVKYAYDNTKFDEENAVKVFDENMVRENWKSNWKEHENITALKASNRYAANFIPVKQRSLNIKEGEELNANQINLAARMEHNRWVTEKLLIGFRAPTMEEEAEIKSDKNKREFYKAKFIHHDIRGYQELGEDHNKIDVKLYDINISRALPYMLKALKNSCDDK